MKKQSIYFLSAILLCVMATFSCKKDFLEKPPSADVTIDTIFSTIPQAQTFLWGTYSACVPTGFPENYGATDGVYAAVLAAADDEGNIGDDWPGSNRFNDGNWGPTSNPEDDYDGHWSAIRKTEIFMEHILDVPGGTPQEKEQMKAEARFLRALQYFELVKRYGGVPIVPKSLTTVENLKIPRSSFEDCVNFIVNDCDSAAALLPDKYADKWRGRATKGAALALKSRMLLYAASPLFNTNTAYVSASDSVRDLIGYPDYDPSRWQKAADAAKAVLDWASTAGCKLITGHGPTQNYTIATEEPDNAEIILANKNYGYWGIWWPYYFQWTMPAGIYGGWYGISVPLNWVKKYQKTNGQYQNWPASGDNLNEMYADLDPRFAQSICYNGSVWNSEIGKVYTYVNDDGTKGNYSYDCQGGQWMRKFLPASVTWSSGGATLNWPVFRLAEFYLNYAEALNEAQGPVTDVYTSINAIRARSGMPDLSANLTQAEMRDAIHNERNVELAFEDQRFWDVRRWKIAGDEGVMNGKMYGLKISQIPNSSDFHFTQYVFESRVWDDKMYLFPFPNTEVYKGYLAQNPGW